MKYFRLDYDTILWGISYVNFVMLQATIPIYDRDDQKSHVATGSENDSLEDVDKFLKRK